MGVGVCRNCGVNWREGWQYCRTCGITRDQGMVTVTSPLEFQPRIDFSLVAQKDEPFRDIDDKSETIPASAFHDISQDKTLTEEEVVNRMYGLAYTEPREIPSEIFQELAPPETSTVAYVPPGPQAFESKTDPKIRLVEFHRNKRVRIAVVLSGAALVMLAILILGFTYLR